MNAYSSFSFSWQKVSAFLKTPTATVRGLDVGKEYEFRVMAENAIGTSEPLQTTSAIKARHPYGKLPFLQIKFIKQLFYINGILRFPPNCLLFKQD